MALAGITTTVSTMRTADSFDRLYREHKALVYSYQLRFLGNIEDAEDATVETFRRAFRSIGTIRDDALQKVWLMRIATNVALTAKSAGRKHATVPLDALADDPHGDPPAPGRVDHDVLTKDHADRILSELPEKQRAAIWMRFGLSLSNEEVAETLNVPVNTVKCWVWRTTSRLREEAMGQRSREDGV